MGAGGQGLDMRIGARGLDNTNTLWFSYMILLDLKVFEFLFQISIVNIKVVQYYKTLFGILSYKVSLVIVLKLTKNC